MRNHDLFAFLVELYHFEVKSFVHFGGAAIFLHNVTGWGKTFNAVWQRNDNALIRSTNNCTLVH